jgi:hypothetical protein
VQVRTFDEIACGDRFLGVCLYDFCKIYLRVLFCLNFLVILSRRSFDFISIY